MIILEGPDNSGKSTLGHLLSASLEVPLIHSQRCDTSMAESLGMTSEEMCYTHALNQLNPEMIIRDRTYTISEWVYGNVVRNKSDMGQALHQQAILNLYYRRYPIIYCRPNNATILRNNGREQMPGVLERHNDIIKAYDQLMEEFRIMGLPIIYYDWQNPGATESILMKVKKHFDEYRRKKVSSMYITGVRE
ncbi:thymidylate kinase [Serratia phage Serbin]|uniref:Thymidylate kinase n=1 Tax=Serratia phage Serbin TaxID=2562181 RepID=A0A482MH72_9CAUD|nr:thymidylate kinase [Serratia phage Serbin]QBQ72969.1 thymidylate kinase [Serratia phage Serbin]